MSDPRPPKRIIDPKAGITKCVREGNCRLCSSTEMQRHHLVSRGQGGDDLEPNLVPLCLTCHERVERRDPGYCTRLRVSLAPDELTYCVLAKGWDWVDHRYPPPGVTAA